MAPVIDDHALKSGVKSLYNSGKYSDFTIVCGEVVYKVHKAIICSQSDFFAAAVEFGKEAEENRIDLFNDEPETVKLMVEHLYGIEHQHQVQEDTKRLLPRFNRLARPVEESKARDRQDLVEKLIRVSKIGMVEAVQFVRDHSRPKSTCENNHRLELQSAQLGELYALLDENAILEDAEEAQESWLTTSSFDAPTLHAKVYAIADKYNIRGLKSASIRNFREVTRDYLVNEGFYDAIDIVYSTTMVSDRGLRDIVFKRICNTVEKIGLSDRVEEKLREIPDLSLDVIKRNSEYSRSGIPQSSIHFSIVGNDVDDGMSTDGDWDDSGVWEDFSSWSPAVHHA